jgi:hypothetical protein
MIDHDYVQPKNDYISARCVICNFDIEQHQDWPKYHRDDATMEWHREETTMTTEDTLTPATTPVEIDFYINAATAALYLAQGYTEDNPLILTNEMVEGMKNQRLSTTATIVDGQIAIHIFTGEIIPNSIRGVVYDVQR